MEANALATAVLLLYVPFSILLFALMRLDRATSIAVLTAVLFLPEKLAFDPPLVPPMDKYSISISIAFLAALLSKLKGGRKSSVLFAFATLWLIAGAIGTTYTNRDPLILAPSVVAPGLTSKDAITVISDLSFLLLLPFAVGRLVYRTPESVAELLKYIVGFAVFYSFFMLIEIRLSPQLHNWVYGYHQHAFSQTVRNEGFRPLVFMTHGLATARFMVTAILAAVGLDRAGQKVFNIKPRYIALFLLLVLVFSNSLGALVLVLLALPLMLIAPPRMIAWFASCVAVIVILFPILRTAGWIPVVELTEIFSEWKPERAASLKFRFDNEDILLDKWSLRRWFGWAGYSRGRVYDQWGKDISTTDGAWIIALSQGGWARFLGQFFLIVMPIWIARKHIVRFRMPHVRHLFAALVLITAVTALDLLPNGMFNYLGMLLAGALFGYSESLSDPRVQAQIAAPAQLRRVSVGAQPARPDPA